MRFRRAALFILLGFQAMHTVACTALDDTRQAGRSQRSVIGGVADAEHTSVVALVSRRATCGAAEELACSGTLIGPRIVLTAAHCLTDLEPTELEVIVGGDIQGSTEIHAVVDGLRHPGYNPSALPEEANDLALLLLDSDAASTPATLPAEKLSEVVIGAALRVVGFGGVSPTAPTGTRLAGDTAVGASTSIAIWTDDTGLPCGGDSGGAMFRPTANGELLVGVIKASAENCTGFALAMRTSGYLDFIGTAVSDLEARTATPPTFDAQVAYCGTTCEQHTDCALGMLCLSDRSAKHCGYRDVRTSNFGDRCTDTDAASCVPVGQGSSRDCRRTVECDASPPPNDSCQSGSGRGSSAVLLSLALLLVMCCSRRPRHA